MWFAAKEDEVRRLHDEGLACLDGKDPDGAIARGQKLVAVGWSGGYELLALGRRMKGDREGALAALDEARQNAPGVWVLAQLRGNVLDDLGRSEDAVAAYDEALAAPGVWAGSVRYNRGVALAHLGRWGDALADAEAAIVDARGAPFALGAVHLATDALGKLGRHDDAISLLDHVASIGDDAAHDLLDLRVGVLARAGKDDAIVRAASERAIEAGAARGEVAKRLAGSEASARHRYRVVLRGPRTEDAGSGGFFRPASVRAKDEAEALALLAALEPIAIRSALALELCERGADEVGVAEVLHVQGRVFYDDDGDAP